MKIYAKYWNNITRDKRRAFIEEITDELINDLGLLTAEAMKVEVHKWIKERGYFDNNYANRRGWSDIDKFYSYRAAKHYEYPSLISERIKIKKNSLAANGNLDSMQEGIKDGLSQPKKDKPEPNPLKWILIAGGIIVAILLIKKRK